jgi:methionine transaminase
MTPSLTSKLPHTPTTIFTIMSGLATQHNALNLSQGFPSFNADSALIDLITEAMHAGHNQYAPMPGVLALREALAQKYQEWLGISYNPATEITITTGATEALYASIATIVNIGDEVIVIEPCYDLYVPTIQLHGGKALYYQTHPSNGFKVDWAELKKLISSKTKAIIINSPQNPCSSMFAKEDFEALSKLLDGSNIFLISDEVYEHIIFDQAPYLSAMQFPVLRERTFICGSFGKTYHSTGWKMGYVLAPEFLTAEFRKIHQWTTFSVNTPIQVALATYLKEKSHFTKLNEFYQAKRDLFRESIKNSKLKILPSQGSFFQCVDYSALSQEADTDLAIRLTKQIGVASIPLSVFYHNKLDYKLLRFCFAKDNSMILEAGHRLSSL